MGVATVSAKHPPPAGAGQVTLIKKTTSMSAGANNAPCNQYGNLMLQLYNLSTHVWKQSEEPCSFDCGSKLTLILRRSACPLARLDSAVRGEKFLQGINILIVNIFYFVLSEIILLFHFVNH